MQIKQIDRTIIKAVSLVSSSQKYQKKVLIFICLLWMQTAYHYLINPIIFTNPLLMQNGIVQTQAYCCQQGNQNKCIYLNQFTATFYMGLYCDNRYMRMMLQSIFSIGSIIGTIYIPMLNDLKGRKFSFYVTLLTTLIGDIGLLIGILNKIQILSALGSNAILPLSYSIGSEFFSDSLRQKSVIYYCLAWGLAHILVILIYYFISYWLLYLIFVILLPISLLLFYFQAFFIQSAHYAINSKHNFELANQTLQKLAQCNNANVNQLQKAKQVLVQLSRKLQKQGVGLEIKQKQKNTIQNLKIIYKNPKYFKALCCITFIKIAGVAFYFGVHGSIERIGLNLGVTCLFIGLGQSIAYSTGSQFIPSLRRLKVIFLTYILLIILTGLFLFDNINQSPFIESIILFLCFIVYSWSFSAASLIESESYPSSIRSTSIGLGFGLSYILRIILPFIIGVFNEHKIPPILASCLLMIIFGVIPPLIADQTFEYKILQQPLIVKQIQLIQGTFKQTKTFQKDNTHQNLHNF